MEMEKRAMDRTKLSLLMWPMWGLTLTAAALVASPTHSLADMGRPAKPRIDCTKPENKNKPACNPHNSSLSDEEIYNGAYWLAHQGQYREALALIGKAENKNDPRLLNITGFSTRKLGDVDGALPYYRKALAIDPNYMLAREYMGEAFVTKGDLASAREQLREIETRCGAGCGEYAKLAVAIAASEHATRS
jgi:tetratricopeptide (TPR) repeat protein